MIDEKLVWEAYRALGRYAWTLGYPADVLPRPVSPKDKAACSNLASLIRLEHVTCPGLADERQFVYLFLWAQWLRVSYAHHPTFMGTDQGWTGLWWAPLWVLAGREHGAVAIRSWRGFYGKLRLSQVEPGSMYPWVTAPEERIPALLDAQLKACAQRTAENEITLGELLCVSPNAYHPWLYLGTAEFWTAAFPGCDAWKRAVLALRALLDQPVAWRLFYTVGMPCLPGPARELPALWARPLLAGIKESRKKLHYTKRWRHAKRRLEAM